MKMHNVIFYLLLFIVYCSLSDNQYTLHNEEIGSLNNALNIMSFHRNMFNEYLCRSYIVDEILINGNSRLKRSQDIKNYSQNNQYSSKKWSLIDFLKNNLIQDEGSLHYMDWLKKSALLHDIYKQTNQDYYCCTNNTYKDLEGTQKIENNQKEILNQNSDRQDEDFIKNYQIPQEDHENVYMNINNNHKSFLYNLLFDKKNYPFIKKKLFHIIMTLIAYTSFGIFVLHVILCISVIKNNKMTPSPVSNTDAENVESYVIKLPNYGNNKHKGRPKRDINKLHKITVSSINDAVGNVLNTFKTIASFNDSQEIKKQIVCLNMQICNSNKASRNLTDGRIWIPIWNLGVSWLYSTLFNNDDKYYTILNNLKASIFGLGNANCKQIYSKCLD